MNKKLSIFAVLMLAIGLTAISWTRTENTAKAAMITCNVPGSHATIQAAVNDLACTTIDVASGVYLENVNVTRTVTIIGAQAGVPAPGRVGAESVVQGANPIGAVATFQVGAPGVVIDGFTVKNSVTTGASHGIAVNGSGSGAVIKNNIFDGITTTDTTNNGTAQAVYLTSGGPDNVLIENNEMKNILSNRSAKGVLIGDNGGANPSQNTVIRANTITNVVSEVRGAYGISVANPAATTAGVTGLLIEDNTISDLLGGTGAPCPAPPAIPPAICGGWVHAIGLEGNTPSALVLNNDISNLNAATADKAAVFFQSNISFPTAEVHNNNFNVGNTVYGIALHPALLLASIPGAVDGECNWWGAPNGPGPVGTGAGALVTPQVDYAPWQIAPEGACIGGNVPTSASQCKNGGWMNQVRADGSTFKNQGDCIQYANTGK